MTVQQLIDSLNTIQDKDSIVIMTSGYEGGYNDISVRIPEPVAMALDVNTDWYYGAHEKLVDVCSEDIDKYTIVKAIVL